MKDFSHFNCPYIDLSKIRDAAEGARRRYWPEYEFPIDIEHIISQRLELFIDFQKGLSHQLCQQLNPVN